VVKAGTKLLALFLGLAVCLRADADAARAAYTQGMREEAAGRTGEAMARYQSALALDPGFSPARRGLGNCYYKSGDKEAALREYRLYLAANPGDAGVQAFAARLNDALYPRGGPASAGPDALLADAFSLGFSLGAVAASGDDMQQLVPGAIVPQNGALAGSLKAGFLSATGFGCELAFTYGPFRSYTSSYQVGAYPYQDTYGFTETSLSARPSFRFPLGPTFTLGLGLGVGLSWAALSYRSTYFAAQNFYGSNVSLEPSLRGSFIFGSFGADFEVGNHYSRSGSMKDASGAPLIAVNPGTGAKSAWAMDSSGLYASVGASYYFSPPVKIPSARGGR
jgi:tetratricopeptide (TPR) repeat protein